MSMETHVLFRGPLPEKVAFEAAMRQFGFPFTLQERDGTLEGQEGFLPMMRNGGLTGVEFDTFDRDAYQDEFVREFADEFVEKRVKPDFERIASFRWGGDMEECVAGLCGAAALAKLVGGIVYDEAEGRLLDVEEVVTTARDNMEILLKQEGAA